MFFCISRKKKPALLLSAAAVLFLFHPAQAADLSSRLAGRILLAVESRGEAWYVSPDSQMRFFLGRPADAFAVMREQGRGITNADLNKIPVGLIALSGADADRDGLGDGLEAALGTNPNLSDSDGDRFSDYEEVKSGYNPLGAGVSAFNTAFSKKQSGRIFLAVEKGGAAWYVNPADYKRYYLGRPADAFAAMRTLGLGVKNADLEEIIARTPGYDLNKLARDIYDGVNIERKKAGLSELIWNNDLAAVAREESGNLAAENRLFTDLSRSCDFPLIHHEGFDFGLYNKDRLNARGVNYFRRTGENIALVSGADIRIYYRDRDTGAKEIDNCQTRRNEMEEDFAARLAAADGEAAKKSTIEGEITLRQGLIARESEVNIASINWLKESEAVSKTVEGWLNSPGHRENIMLSEYDETGLGVAYVNGYLISTQIFIRRADCGFPAGPCCEEEGYYPYCFEPLSCEAGFCR
jgi:uncharacterized protein YkwD